MSIILNALEKAQRENMRKEKGINGEDLLHQPSSLETASRFSWKVFFAVIVINLVLFSAGIGYFLYGKKVSSGRKPASGIAQQASPVLEEKGDSALKAQASQDVPDDLSEGPVYKDVLMLDNGLRLKVDGVYLDNKVPYALIGPDIVKAGDVMEGDVKVISVDFKKVELEYRKSRYFLTVK
jgi:hypothetical protein